MPPGVVTNTCSEIDQKMVGTLVTGSEVHAIARWLVAVKTSALPTNSGHQIRADLFVQSRLVYAVEIKKNWTIGLTSGAAVGTLTRSPRRVEAEAHSAMEDHVSTEIDI